jgi:hypothetical protein
MRSRALSVFRFAPRMAFFATWINAFRLAAAFFASLKRDRMLVTAFHSPATVPAFTDPIPRSTIPACYFASNDTVSTPVRLSAPRLIWFAPHRPLLCFSPLYVPGIAPSAPAQSPLPFRTFTSLRIKAFNCAAIRGTVATFSRQLLHPCALTRGLSSVFQ